MMSGHPSPPAREEQSSPAPESLYCNQSFQEAFREFNFDGRGMNLHMQTSASERHAVIFVHGFDGSGYSTWGRFPQLLFDTAELGRLDVGVFQYNTGYLAAVKRSVHVPPTIRRLTAVIQEMALRYTTITFMCHSLGGILAEAAVAEYLTDHAIATDGAPNVKIAAMFLFGSPRAGTWMAPSIARRLFREFHYLSHSNDTLTDIDRFFTKYVESELVAISDGKKYLIPRYVCMGDGDNVAQEFSVTYGVSDGRIYYPNLNHRQIAKPDSASSPLVVWVSQGMREVADLRRQSLREGVFRSEQMQKTAPPQVNYVTELWSGSFGYQGKMLYDKLRKEYDGAKTITGRPIVILDREEIPTSNVHVDLLLSLHDATTVIDNHEVARPPVLEARNRKLTADRLTVGIAAVGERSKVAKDVIEGWLAPNRPLRGFYVEPAKEEDDLQLLLRSWLASMIKRELIGERESHREFDSKEKIILDANSPWGRL